MRKRAILWQKEIVVVSANQPILRIQYIWKKYLVVRRQIFFWKKASRPWKKICLRHSLALHHLYIRRDYTQPAFCGSYFRETFCCFDCGRIDCNVATCSCFSTCTGASIRYYNETRICLGDHFDLFNFEGGGVANSFPCVLMFLERGVANSFTCVLMFLERVSGKGIWVFEDATSDVSQHHYFIVGLQVPWTSTHGRETNKRGRLQHLNLSPIVNCKVSCFLSTPSLAFCVFHLVSKLLSAMGESS